MTRSITLIVFMLAQIAFVQAQEISSDVKNASALNIDTSITNPIHRLAKNFPEGTQLSVAIIDDGVVSNYGVLVRENSVEAIDNKDKVFEIGSISKVFTSILLAHLHQDSALSIDDDINEYLDINLVKNEKISFVDLANHTSGLPKMPSNMSIWKSDPFNPYKDYKEEKLEEYLQNDLKIKSKQKGKKEYSNLGVAILGYALTKIKDQSYEELLQEYFFAKYDMNSSTTDRSLVEDKVVPGLGPTGKLVPNWDLAAMNPAGGILSTTSDMAKFVLSEVNEVDEAQIFARQQTLTLTETRGTGLGWVIFNRRDGKTFYWHNGGTGGYTSSMCLDVENKNGIVILSNVSVFHKKARSIDDVSFDLLKAIGK